ncbi:cytochrome c oxidase assembly protein [Speluncibacter jeojiensis]|uniref:Cytochrome c oxidase assembly protein n=1 Tax=Speluncibacter jeojiensis TaxID=2710754 RepID=A0A9X4RBY7_9ACTN|nr:cytochrome c oxidase assembly protein [Corynebacteriales bacterium D3-21]
MAPQSVPQLHLITTLTAWKVDWVTLVIVVASGVGYVLATRKLEQRGTPVEPSRRGAFLFGLVLWLLATMSFVGVYENVLFWVRALQVILLMMLIPFMLAFGVPLTVLRELLGESGRARFDRILHHRVARILTAPATTSIIIIATPWLLYYTQWYPTVLDNATVDTLTKLALVAVGFLYFYSRLQADPVPHKYPAMLSIAITFTEVLVDASLGLALWLGPLRAPEHYEAIARTWGPDLQTDQIVGAGIIWILGDLIGVPFLFALMRAMTKDEQASADKIDAELDAQDQARARAAAEAGIDESQVPGPSRLWWEDDPELSERFKRG